MKNEVKRSLARQGFQCFHRDDEDFGGRYLNVRRGDTLLEIQINKRGWVNVFIGRDLLGKQWQLQNKKDADVVLKKVRNILASQQIKHLSLAKTFFWLKSSVHTMLDKK